MERDTASTHEDPFNGLLFLVGVAENKNAAYRAKMEDVHTYVANFAERIDWGYFAIFDGHAGKQAARWCGNNLHTLVEQEIAAHDDADLRNTLQTSFTKADTLLEKDGAGGAGCTAAVAIVRWESDGQAPMPKSQAKGPFDFVPTRHHRRMLYTANVGDLRIVLCRDGQAYRLTYDHKALDLNEVNRIRDAGGLVLRNRVNGVLAITRSLGDSYIKSLVTEKPFTTATQLDASDEFLILACDGVWDVLLDAVACKYVRDTFAQQKAQSLPYDPQAAAKRLCLLALENQTTDNVTAMVVRLNEKVFEQT